MDRADIYQELLELAESVVWEPDYFPKLLIRATNYDDAILLNETLRELAETLFDAGQREERVLSFMHVELERKRGKIVGVEYGITINKVLIPELKRRLESPPADGPQL